MICSNDGSALPLLYTAAASGVNVPGDLSVITVMHTHMQIYGLNLDAVLLPQEEMAEAGIGAVVLKVESPSAQFAPKATPCRLSLAGSSAAVG